MHTRQSLVAGIRLLDLAVHSESSKFFGSHAQVLESARSLGYDVHGCRQFLVKCCMAVMVFTFGAMGCNGNFKDCLDPLSALCVGA